MTRRGLIAGLAAVVGVSVLAFVPPPDSTVGRLGVSGGQNATLSMVAGSTASGTHSDAVVKEIALELVSTAENSTKEWKSAYPYIQDIGDGRGYTAGIVGFCSGTGDMLALVQYYSATTPGNPLQGYIPRLQTVMAAPYESRPRLSHALLGAAFVTSWRTAAKTAQFQAAQRHERDRVYWDPAMAEARRDGLGSTGLYIYFDVYVNQGPGNDRESFGGIVAGVQAHGHLSPAQGGNQVDYLNAIIAARDKVLHSSGAYQPDGRSTIGLKLLAEKNLSLKLPLMWTVYGAAFSITTPPVS